MCVVYNKEGTERSVGLLGLESRMVNSGKNEGHGAVIVTWVGWWGLLALVVIPLSCRA